MTNRLIYLTIALVAGLFAGVGDIFLNYWAKSSNQTILLVWGVMLFNASVFMFAGLLRRGLLVESLVIYIVANVLFVTLFSYFILQEPMNSYRWFWLFTAVISVVAVELL